MLIASLGTACASVDEPASSSGSASPPPQAKSAADEARPKDANSVDLSKGEKTALRHLTPELVAAFRLSSAVSVTAAKDFDAAVARIRGDSRQERSLRSFYADLPIDAYVARQQIVHLIGYLGTADDVPLLESLALTPLPAVMPTGLPDEHSHEHGEPTAVDQQATLRNASVVALSRLAARGDQASLASLRRLLADGDKDMALLAHGQLAASVGHAHFICSLVGVPLVADYYLGRHQVLDDAFAGSKSRA